MQSRTVGLCATDGAAIPHAPFSSVSGLTDAEAHYRKMYDRISSLAKIGVWECDLTTGKIDWTDQIYDMFEIPRGAALDRDHIVSLYEQESREQMDKLRSRVISGGGNFAMDIRVRTARGNLRWIRLTCDVEQENGISVRLFGTKQDITQAMAAQERVQALQAELIQLSRRSAMGTLVATLAHDLNQPLTAIANYIAGMRRGLSRPEPDLDMLGTGIDAIGDNAHRAGTIIRQLRDLTEGSTVKLQRLDPEPLIRQAAQLALRNAGNEAVLVSFDFAEDLNVDLDPLQIQQVVINLVLNACEALTHVHQPKIRISAMRCGDELDLRVEDNGAGIDPDVAETLFESFVTSSSERMGVGLAICRTIVEAHGGRISACNGPDGGASICVRLPVVVAPTEDQRLGKAKAI